MKQLFVGGPWDGQVRDLAELGVTDERRRSGILVSASTSGDRASYEQVFYYPRRYAWDTALGGVAIEVMANSISEPLGGRLLLHLFRLAGLDVTWEHDPNDPG